LVLYQRQLHQLHASPRDECGVRLRARVIQYLSFHDGQAAKVAKNWSIYGAEVVLATEEEIAKLEPRCQAHVHDCLTRPGNINNRYTNP
jgi:hypothetical protein